MFEDVVFPYREIFIILYTENGTVNHEILKFHPNQK